MFFEVMLVVELVYKRFLNILYVSLICGGYTSSIWRIASWVFIKTPFWLVKLESYLVYVAKRFATIDEFSSEWNPMRRCALKNRKILRQR
jgi:hypothetical protein